MITKEKMRMMKMNKAGMSTEEMISSMIKRDKRIRMKMTMMITIPKRIRKK